MNLNTPKRFWDRVSKTDGCWEWQGSRMPKGYGQLSYGKRHTYSHRVSWELTFGEIPEGMNVLHACDNPPCVNPDHLFLGTCKDNTLDAVSKNRMAFGSRHGISKLTEEQVREIRTLWKEGTSQADLCRRYGVGCNAVWNIVHNRTWQRVNA